MLRRAGYDTDHKLVCRKFKMQVWRKAFQGLASLAYAISSQTPLVTLHLMAPDRSYSKCVDILRLHEREYRDWLEENDAKIHQLLETWGREQTCNERLETWNQNGGLTSLLNFKMWLINTIFFGLIRFFCLLRTCLWSILNFSCSIKSIDSSTLIKISQGIMEGQQKHFTDVFFNPSMVNEAVVESMPEYDIILE